MQATFELNNSDYRFTDSGINEISVGDIVDFDIYYEVDLSQKFDKFYGFVNQRSINKTAMERSISIVCLDYISITQFMDIDLEIEGNKILVEEETLTPNYLSSPNENLAQIFDFTNNSLADNPLPIITIRNKNTTEEDPLWDGFCYSNDTEVLTENGWKLLKDIVENKEKVKIATLNPEKNEVEYHYPLDYMSYNYKDKMFVQDSKSINLSVTKNHRLWVKPLNTTKYIFIEANKSPKNIFYKKDFPYKGNEEEYFILPEYKNEFNVIGGIKKFFGGKIQKQPDYIQHIYKKELNIKMDYWLQFLGVYLAEGWTIKGRIFIAQSPNSYKLKEITRLLKESGFKFVYSFSKKKLNKGVFKVCNKQLAIYLKQFGKARTKFIPRKLLNLSKRQSLILLNSLMVGDGNYKKYKNNEGSNYYTSSKQLANNVQELALKCGYASNIKETFDKKYNIIRYEIRINKNIEVLQNYSKDGRNFIPYNNKVYCIEIPNNIMYVRRKGKGCWCGNSIIYSEGQLKLGFPLNARYNYDLIALSYYFYSHGIYAEDVIKEILIQTDGYSNYLFKELTQQALINNHLTETFQNVEGAISDYLVPNYSDSEITIETTLTSAVTIGNGSIIVTDTSGFPITGNGNINGDAFSWSGKTATTLTGIPSSGIYPLA